MRWLLPLLAGMALALGAWLIWSFLGEEEIRPRAGGGGESPDPFAAEERVVSAGGGADAVRVPGMPEWMIGRVTPGAAPRGRMDGLPDSIGRIEMLTRGRTKSGANTLRLKVALSELREAMLAMSPEEAARLAAFFESCEDPTTKYYLLIAFRSWGGEPFVDVVRDYYEAEPEMVAEALSYMLTRTPRAAGAFEDLIREEFDPLRRAKLVSRAGFTGAPAGERLMLDLFRRSGKTPERRLALWGLARNGSEEGKLLIRDLLDGPEEKAAYAVGEVHESDPELADLRCHGVLALLMTGSPEDIGDLLGRARGGGDDIGHYVDRFFAVVREPRFVPEVVELLEERGAIEDRYLIYLNNQAQPEHRAALERLLDLARDRKDREALQLIIDRLN